MLCPIRFKVTIEENLTNTVTMYDLPYTDLTVIKKIRADHINFANGNPTFVITVKGNDLLGNRHEYSEFYEFTKEYVQQHTESDGYVSVKYTWKGIPAGNAYEVTENDVNRYYLSQVTSADENVSIGTAAGIGIWGAARRYFSSNRGPAEQPHWDNDHI